MSLIKKTQNIAFQNSLWKKGAKLVLGVSGGPDSVCMLDVMAKLAPKYDLKIIIAHVNYGLRGADSQKDEKFVRALADKYCVPAFFMKPDFKKKVSENALRDVRYEFFERLRTENKFDSIAVAHNADDQVETFLMRVIRGAGLQGLSAMKYKSVYTFKSAKGGPAEREFNRGTIIRPLLALTRLEILEHLKKQNLSYRTDKTNRRDLFLRNRIRNKLIPYLEKNFNPKIKKTIFDAAASIGEDYSLLQEVTDNSYMKNIKKGGLSAKKITGLHPALQRRIMLRLIYEKKKDSKDTEASHIEEIIKALKSTKSKNQIVTFKGLKVVRKGDRVTLDNF